MFGVAVVDVFPSFFHAFDFGGIMEAAEESLLKSFRRGAGKHAGDIHVGVAGTSKAKVDHPDHFVVFVEEDVAEIEVAVHQMVHFGVFDEGVIGVDVLFVVFIVELVEEVA